MRYTDDVSALGETASPRPSKLGRYELITQIGQGGMAEVQLAIQRGPAGFEKLVVVKLVHENLATDETFVDMLLDEARMAALVKHPNVVDIYDLGEAEGRYFIAMEYLEGEPLLAVLRAGREGKRLDPLSTARLIADTAEGLDAAHELRSMAGDPIELVHHDVSLGNIVVLYNGQVKLVDFGVAKATLSSAVPTKVQGKFSYMAPEKLHGKAGDRRSDIWSLGCVLWEALTLRRLFKGGNDHDTMRQVLEAPILKPSEVNGEVIADFDPIVLRALERDPDLRYPSAKEMATDLEEVLRKQGYGGRNDQIAKYMQATFDAHIVARKKLLQEVSSKGRASAAVLEAAFDEPAPRANRASGDFSGKLNRTSAEILAEGTPQQPSGSLPGAEASIDEPTGDIPRGARSDKYRWTYLTVGAIAVALVAVIVVSVLVATRGGDDPDRKEPIANDPFAVTASSGDTVRSTKPTPTPAGSGIPTAGSGSATRSGSNVADSGSDAIEILPNEGSAVVAKPAIKILPKEKPNAVELHRAGLQEFAAGDYKTALTSFKRAQLASPGYAPAWRGLGMVHEKLRQNTAARSAFQRYLTLAPNAPDVTSVRARMEKL